MREPGESLLAEARRVVIPLLASDERLPENTPICSGLTPRCCLDQEFPSVIEGTLYHLFSTATAMPDRVAVLVEDPKRDQDQAIREAALGMMDNLCFR